MITRDALLAVLSRHIGEARGAHVRQLVAELRDDLIPDGAAERRVRALVEDLRREGHHICAHPQTGYYLAATPAELDRTCEFLYQRALASLAQIAAMKRISLPDLRGQLHLPT